MRRAQGSGTFLWIECCEGIGMIFWFGIWRILIWKVEVWWNKANAIIGQDAAEGGLFILLTHHGHRVALPEISVLYDFWYLTGEHQTQWECQTSSFQQDLTDKHQDSSHLSAFLFTNAQKFYLTNSSCHTGPPSQKAHFCKTTC